MKRSPLKRTGWMRRTKKPLRRKSSMNSDNREWRSKGWTDAAAGQACVFCEADEKVCARHVRLPGFCGTNQKPADYLVLDLCSDCDRKYGELNRRDDAADVLLGLAKTLRRRCELGFLGEGD